MLLDHCGGVQVVQLAALLVVSRQLHSTVGLSSGTDSRLSKR